MSSPSTQETPLTNPDGFVEGYTDKQIKSSKSKNWYRVAPMFGSHGPCPDCGTEIGSIGYTHDTNHDGSDRILCMVCFNGSRGRV